MYRRNGDCRSWNGLLAVQGSRLLCALPFSVDPGVSQDLVTRKQKNTLGPSPTSPDSSYTDRAQFGRYSAKAAGKQPLKTEDECQRQGLYGSYAFPS